MREHSVVTTCVTTLEGLAIESNTSKPKRARDGHPIVHFESTRGLWVGRATLPPDPITGKRRSKTVTSIDKKVAQSKLDDVLANLRQHGDLNTRNPSLAQWLEHWLGTVIVGPRTIVGYRSKSNLYLVPILGKIRISQLTVSDVRRLTATMTGKMGLSSSSARAAQTVLTNALNAAMVERLMTWNPSAAVKRPLAAIVKDPFLDVAQSKKLIASTESDRFGARYALALLTGCRQGEALGLELDRIDWTPGAETIQLDWQLQRISWIHAVDCINAKTKIPACGRKRGVDCPGRYVEAQPDWEHRQLGDSGLYLTRPKTSAGIRMIPLVEPLLSILRQRAGKAALENNPLGFVFTQGPHKRHYHGSVYTAGGAPINPAADSLAWHAALKAAGLPQVKLHSCRHSAVTVLDDLGVPDRVIQMIVGHSALAATKVYTHRDTGPARRALTEMSTLCMSADSPVAAQTLP